MSRDLIVQVQAEEQAVYLYAWHEDPHQSYPYDPSL